MSGDRFSLANRAHLTFFVGLLVASGAICPDCGMGTRKTSKRWAKCKGCGARVQRRGLDECITPDQQNPATGSTKGDGE